MTETSPHIEIERYHLRMRTREELAKEMGVSRNYILAMRRRGLRFPGGKASLRMVEDFLSTSPDFKVREHSQGSPQPSAASFGITHVPYMKSARRKPSSGSPKNPLQPTS